jgi:hypothetical protein
MTRGDGKFRAKNKEHGLSTSAMDTPELAIAAAYELDAGKTISISPASGIEFVPPKTNLPVKLIEVKSIRLDGGTRTREPNPDLVKEYKEDMLRGDQFPAVHVFDDGKEIWLARGFNRTEATIEAKLAEILAVVHQGTLRDAILFSLGGNATHGKRRSNEEKRNAVLKLLTDPEWSEWSDNLIAEKAAVSQPYVSELRRDLRRELASKNVLSEGEDAPPSQSTLRRGKDNVLRETKKIGRQTKTKITAGQADIDVEAPPVNREVNKQAETARDHSVLDWPEESLNLNVIVNAGKSARRGLTISGRAGDGNPIFSSTYTLADLEPLPSPLEAMLRQLKKQVDARNKRTAKPAAKSAKKKKPARKK